MGGDYKMALFFQILTPIVTVLSVWLTYFLGLRSKSSDLEINKIEERYYSYYIPLLKLCYALPSSGVSSYMNLRAFYQKDVLTPLLTDNIQYLSEDLLSIYINYYQLVKKLDNFLNLESKGIYDKKVDKSELIENIERYSTKIIIQSCKDANLLAQALKLPSIGQKLIEHISNSSSPYLDKKQ